MGEHVFPLPRPESGNDSRFTFGLLVDVRDVLIAHGYPMDQATGRDLVELRQALFRFLYASPQSGPAGGEW
ncbi:hypothetical protein DI005_34880 [Prauserella sp. PE36]|uniref:hypothetical protein n=1 Tax=Prauserella sp. PE36 TaxID=1504709 RepID=UPI000DE1BCCB|nr:hypothetical protein [Prauserella sp. PE36]RBM11094.1 hypothetical protein DI005_34880 [Prauserella sp. PE36]